MKKLVIALLAVLLASFLAVGFFIDSIAASAIEDRASSALGVPVRTGSVDVGLLAGGFSLSGLQVDNPEGFDSPQIVSLENLEMEVSLGTLMSDKIVAPKMHLRGMSVWLEGQRGRTNIQAIQENLRKSSAAGGEGGGEPRRFVIEEVLIENITAKVNLPPLAREMTLEIPRIRLENVGTANDNAGVTQRELIKQIIDEVGRQAQREAVRNPEGVVDKVRELIDK